MHYVKHFDILGVDTKQIACIELQGVPTAATEGAVGVLGVDMTSGTYEVYICTAVNGNIYTWQCLKDGKDGTCVVKAEINSLGELLIILSDGKEINVGVVKGEQGVPGTDGKDGENGADGKNGENGVDGQDGVSVVKAELNAAYELIFTLSNDTIINVGVVRGEPGEIPPNCMYTDTEQTITGEKTFNAKVKVDTIYHNTDRTIATVTDDSNIMYLGDQNTKTYIEGSTTRPYYRKGGSSEKEMALLKDFNDRVIGRGISSDGLMWWREWSSGFKEVWGLVTVPSSNTLTTVQLPFEFNGLNYTVNITNQITDIGPSQAIVGDTAVINKDTNSFQVRGYNGPKNFYVSGYMVGFGDY